MARKTGHGEYRYPTREEFAERLRRWVQTSEDTFPEDQQKGFKILIHPDPEVPGTYASRITFNGKEGEPIDLLFCGDEFAQSLNRRRAHKGEELSVEEIAMEFEGFLEEGEWDEWPPKSSEEALARSIFLT